MKMLRTLYLLIWVLTPGCLALTGPAEVTGYIGGSLRLSCHYEEAFEQNTKFWCKGYQFIEVCSSSITKSESEEKVEKDRVSIEDNKKQHYFNVTMDKLRLEDDGFYQCGIERRIIGPEGITTKQPELNHPIKTTESNTSFTPSKPGKSKSKVVIYCIVLLFILLLLAAVVLVVVSRKKKRGSCVQREKEINLSEMASEKREEVPYATLMISDLQEKSIYANADLVCNPTLPQTTTEEVVYTEVAKNSKC
ncbi:CMRF35-like molecule 7 isoform X2 [Hemicordylus capensis]|uniref:CMRF35-like molecule 7 isoform X2 n=1 Tax=Hemicordylus capensis TaxID=884348 RepID=UPI002302356B|nr:CMRF35-like molecule 7 isoform X2 [Hemicordylus capensis]